MRDHYVRLGLSGGSNVTACGPRWTVRSRRLPLRAFAAGVNASRLAAGMRPYDYACWFSAGGRKECNQPLSDLEATPREGK